MKKFLSVLLAVTILLSLTVCAAAEEGGKTVTIAWSTEIMEFCPWNTYGDVDLQMQVHEQLVRYDENDQLVGMLAESWEAAEDGMSYIFHLRKDAKFSNGDPVTADDVVYSMTMAKKAPATGAMTFGIDSWEAIDEHTVKLNMSVPFAAILSQLVIPTNSVCNKKVVESYGYEWPNQPVEGTGSGAYYIAEYIPGDRLVLKANPYYWGGTPDITTINWRFIGEASSAAIALQNGEVDFYNYVTTLDASLLKNDPNVAIDETVNVGNIYLYCNVSDGNKSSPIANKLVRQAINYAIDRDALVTLGCEGDGYGTSTLIPPVCNGYDASFEITRDVEKAKALLAEAGYANGCELTLTYSPAAHVAYAGLAEGLQAQLAEIGITLKLNVVDNATRETSSYKLEYGDLGLNVIYMSVMDPIYTAFFSTGTADIGTINWCGYSNPELDKIMIGARTAIDPAKQAELVKQATKIILDDAPVISLINGGINRAAYRSDRWKLYVTWDKRISIWDWKSVG